MLRDLTSFFKNTDGGTFIMVFSAAAMGNPQQIDAAAAMEASDSPSGDGKMAKSALLAKLCSRIQVVTPQGPALN